MRQALIEQKGWRAEDLPCENTIGNILNRLGYRLRRVQKAKPVKRVQQTNAIFENVREANQAADQREEALRISIDTKARWTWGISPAVAKRAANKRPKPGITTCRAKKTSALGDLGSGQRSVDDPHGYLSGDQ